MCQGLGHFSGFLHHFVLAKLATSSIRVKSLINRGPAYDARLHENYRMDRTQQASRIFFNQDSSSSLQQFGWLPPEGSVCVVMVIVIKTIERSVL